jgi:mxaJ protein
LPFSNRGGAGFENRIVELVARDMGLRVRYAWWPQRRGFVRKTLVVAAKCDLWPGVAVGLDRLATSHPYYRSTYVFVSRAAAPLAHLTLDDSRLRDVAIGVQMIGNDATNTPPAHAIANRGLVENVRGYMLYGDYGRPSPAAAIVRAVAKGEIDVALVWGPLAGYFVHRSRVPLRLEAVTPQNEPRWPMAFDIAMGVRLKNPELRDRVNDVLAREQPAIDAILRAYHVPLESPAGTSMSIGER